MAIKLSGLAPQNPWWKYENWGRDDYDLKHLDIIFDRKDIEIKDGKLYIIRGIRRSGKTVYTKLLVKNLLEKIDNSRKIIYISCDRHSLGEIKNIVNEFIRRFNGKIVIFDEITYHRNWNILLKELIETTDLTIIATGSNPIGIKERRERLPGRRVEGNEYFLNPLSFREFIHNTIKNKDKIRNIDIKMLVDKIKETTAFSVFNPNIEEAMPFFEEYETLLYHYLLTGGFPDAVLEYIKNDRIDERIYEMMIRLFLGELSKENKDEENGRIIMEKILYSMGSRVDFTTIAADIGLHHNTVREYIELFEDARLLYLLYAWDINKERLSIRRQKKIIFQSSLIPQALYQYLTGCRYDDILDYIDKNLEKIVEQTVLSHIIQSIEKPVVREKHSFAGFYYDSNECDLLIRRNSNFYGFEVKYGRIKEQRYPFKVSYITRDTIDENLYPASLFLLGVEKSEKII